MPERGNSPSILEGVPVGRGSNIKHQNSFFSVNRETCNNNPKLFVQKSDIQYVDAVVTEIIFEEGYYKHINKHGFQTEKGAAKYYTLSQGLEWNGGDCMEDYC